MRQDRSGLSKSPGRRFRDFCVRVLIGYGIIVLVLAFIQRKLMYVPTVEPAMDPPAVDSGTVEAVSTTTEDGITTRH